MNYTIENPKGIDKQIQTIQTALFDKIGWENIEAFGRVHRNKSKDKGLVPEFYVGNNEYKDVFTNDKVSSTISFIDDEVHKKLLGGFFDTEVKIVFCVNLKKLKSSIIHRADMEVEIDALKLVSKHKIFSVTGFEKGVETVFKGFNIDHIKLSDMQPYHVFAIVGRLKYKINC